ncbi:hypothetical protein F2P56_011519 [Juglans regia]|uniref:Uncharacterized protein LOC109001043 n=2 Tax=Juglans regia TaxID=51240 RepID=A0A2I4FPW8_JUGRE|nr:uncharacterized protein LOC109001043 [Juglans regia]KAF5471044.1 hypothetical protein F2P56_011519 [Juglans regia]
MSVEVHDFRPISLVSGVYKIISKILAKRLSEVMGKIISKSQSAFVKGRQILDSVLIANECLESRVRNSTQGLLCKLDMKKAFDHVNWDFLLYILGKHGFGERWCQWIKHCITTVSFSTLINGTPEGFFRSSRGLRQGDPLSPLLFILVMDVLSRMLEGVVDRGFISGFSVGSSLHESLSVAHLLFADDTLIFCDSDPDQICSLRALLLCFEAISSLKVNLLKSELVPDGLVNNLSEVTAILGCKVSLLPNKYLGLPLGAPHKSKAMWDGIVEKIECKLAGVANRLEKIFRDFLWGGLEDEKKLHLIKWDKVCTPLSCGGLGIRKLRIFNKALLGKWLWQYHQEGDALWRSIIDIKYGSIWGDWYSNAVRGAYGVGVWKFIRNGWEDLLSNFIFEVGRGTRIRFWHDIWCGDVALENAFPSLYRIASDKKASVADNMSISANSFHWSVSFSRVVQDWEVNDIVDFYNILYALKVQVGREDGLIWTHTGNKKFSVRSYYKFFTVHPTNAFPWKSIWKSNAPFKVAFFGWLASHGKILTIDKLKKRGIYLTDWCFMCKHSSESTDHLLLHCEVVKALWDDIFTRLGIAWVMPRRVSDLFSCWRGIRGNRHIAAVWKMVPLCLMCCTWIERNGRCFENRERSPDNFRAFFYHTLLLWASSIVLYGRNFNDFYATFRSA